LSFYDALTLFVHNEYKEYFNEFERWFDYTDF
jgi:hypothetical protein